MGEWLWRRRWLKQLLPVSRSKRPVLPPPPSPSCARHAALRSPSFAVSNATFFDVFVGDSAIFFNLTWLGVSRGCSSGRRLADALLQRCFTGILIVGQILLPWNLWTRGFGRIWFCLGWSRIWWQAFLVSLGFFQGQCTFSRVGAIFFKEIS